METQQPLLKIVPVCFKDLMAKRWADLTLEGHQSGSFAQQATGRHLGEGVRKRLEEAWGYFKTEKESTEGAHCAQ
jgi:hypothetical protein